MAQRAINEITRNLEAITPISDGDKNPLSSAGLFESSLYTPNSRESRLGKLGILALTADEVYLLERKQKLVGTKDSMSPPTFKLVGTCPHRPHRWRSPCYCETFTYTVPSPNFCEYLDKV